MEDLEKQFEYIESVKLDILEGDYLVLMNLLREAYLALPVKDTNIEEPLSLCIECGEYNRSYGDKCEYCFILFEEDDMLNINAVLSDDDDDDDDDVVIYNRY